MQVRIILIPLGIFFSGTAAAAAVPVDSVGVENSGGKQVVIHRVESKETYYSLGRKYHIAPKKIIEFNKNQPLKVGTQLRIPTDRPYLENRIADNKQQTQANKLQDKNILDYKVGPKETLYSIARRFNTTVDDIKKLNKLKSDALKVGSLIKVYQGGVSDASIPLQVENPGMAGNDSANIASLPDTGANSDEKRLRIASNRYGLREVNERGVAVWISDESLDGTKMLALHRTAPVGTVIKITNPMTDRSTYAKVVGKFNENETTKDVILVITKATADLLGALDKRFQVNIDYGVPNE